MGRNIVNRVIQSLKSVFHEWENPGMGCQLHLPCTQFPLVQDTKNGDSSFPHLVSCYCRIYGLHALLVKHSVVFFCCRPVNVYNYVFIFPQWQFENQGSTLQRIHRSNCYWFFLWRHNFISIYSIPRFLSSVYFAVLLCFGEGILLFFLICWYC